MSKSGSNATVFHSAKSLFHLLLTGKRQDNLLASYGGRQHGVIAAGFFLTLLCEYLNNLDTL